jgi:ABC-type iron transport system FetAB permease component
MNLTTLYVTVLKRHATRQVFLASTSAKRRLRSVLRLFLISTTMLIATSSNAHAYIDPGYGSLLWQLLIAGFFGSLFYIRNIILKVKTWFGSAKKNHSKVD